MHKGGRQELMWGLGLTDQERLQIERAMGPGFQLRNFTEGTFPRRVELEQGQRPSAAWIPQRIWQAIPEFRRDLYKSMESTQRILIQDEREENVDLETVLEEGFLTVIRSPLTDTKVQDAVFRAKEVTSLYSDIYRMTQEIFLERELLQRKTDQLLFLNRILSKATESLDARTILVNARKDLKMLFPLRMLHCALWRSEDGGEAELFLNGRMNEAARMQWTELLLESVSRLGGGTVNDFQITLIDDACRPERSESPDDGRVMALPLRAAGSAFGCMIMLADNGLRLAKDQVEAMNAAVGHLGLALRNAMTFSGVQTRADRDGLTRIHNRRSFDERLLDEMRRHQRYGHELSLLMVDLDHFKQINDTHGHPAGDMVLREVGSILQSSLRVTDFTARYGGEEFVVLLPHTSEQDARSLAERIRRRIESCAYCHEGKNFRATASIGVASLKSGPLSAEEDLVLLADKALYAAKHNGRNTVVVSGAEQPLAAGS